MNKDRIEKLNFTIVGGPSHGMRVPQSNGCKPVSTMPQRSHGGLIEHISHRFLIGENDAVVTVFSPPNLSIAVIQEFINEGYADNQMREFNPWLGHFSAEILPASAFHVS